jgi:hypothetical protein
MILTLFLQGAEPPVNPPEPTAFFTGDCPSQPTVFFITHFSICHSFLDFLYIGVFCGVSDFTLFKKEIEIDKSHKG